MNFRWYGNRHALWGVAVALAFTAAGILAFWPSALQRQASGIQDAVAAIRGLDFKYPIKAKRLSRGESRAYIVGEAAKSPKIADYWSVMRTLGLYRGPDLEPPEKILGDLTGFAAGAYDAYTDTFFLFTDLDQQEQNGLFAHELAHGLQDQHFDLQRYLLDKARQVGANQDEVLARQAVVEGEASYIAAIYQNQLANNSPPTREQLAAIVAAQIKWNPDQWGRALQNPAVTPKMRERLLQAIETRKRLPPFMFEVFFGAYIDGMAFIHAVQARGWTEVGKLYREYPPVSMEQILHPEKWFAREAPLRIAWPKFATEPLFADWVLLQENVLGERNWQVIFRQQGLESEAPSAAAGWNGDRYAVFKHRHENKFLMLMYTSWDTAADAAEFDAAYRRLLEAKYRAAAAPSRVFAQGRDVLIVEGATEESADAFMGFNRSAVLTGR
ncbi:MAG TPA: hypothetical protein VGO61_19370 [Steroidobacteraceae bacterium]|jgi:hypothetical protein|nr:hypothetical protein [Steroidobacteraceae bacterium]